LRNSKIVGGSLFIVHCSSSMNYELITTNSFEGFVGRETIAILDFGSQYGHGNSGLHRKNVHFGKVKKEFNK